MEYLLRIAHYHDIAVNAPLSLSLPHWIQYPRIQCRDVDVDPFAVDLEFLPKAKHRVYNKSVFQIEIYKI